MESQPDDFMAAGSNDVTQIVRGKRTKRQRPSSPRKAVGTSSSSSTAYVYGDGTHGHGGENGEYVSVSSPTICSEVCESSHTEEEEDMAYCLILLAQGDGREQIEARGRADRSVVSEKSGATRFSDMATPIISINKAGFYVYECKTCNRSFPSFQALGGHRASHKKPKAAVVEEKKGLTVASSVEDLDDQLNKNSTPDSLSLQIGANSNKGFLQVQGNSKAKIHECSICGSEFTSGQALGGHMRRHRAAAAGIQVGMTTTDSSSTPIESNIHIHGGDHHHQMMPRYILALDLNLPAPPEDDHHHRESNFQFTSAQQALVFSSPALVDCHY